MINESKLNNRMFHLMESGFFGKQLLSEAEETKQGAYGDPYQYKRVSDSSGNIKYFYAKKGDSNWTEQKYPKGISEIQRIYFPNDFKDVTSSEKPNTSSEKPNTSSEKKEASSEKTNTSSEKPNTSSEKTNTSSEKKEAPSEKSSFASKFMNSGAYDAIFVAGLTSKVGIEDQIQYFKNGFGKDANVAAFYYTGAPYGHKQTIAQVLADNPKIPAFLFSAGAGQVYNIASNGNADVNKIFVIEPYYDLGQTVKPKIDAAVSAGVPANHIYVGAYAGVGLGVIQGATSTSALNSRGHFDAVTVVARKHNVA